MNLVWPLTALFGSVLWVLAYYTWGRQPLPDEHPTKAPFLVRVGKGTSHAASMVPPCLECRAQWRGLQRVTR
jgi:hypothetical protein